MSKVIAEWFDSAEESNRRRCMQLLEGGWLVVVERETPAEMWPPAERVGPNFTLQKAREFAATDRLTAERIYHYDGAGQLVAARCGCEAACCEGVHPMGGCPATPEGAWTMDYVGAVCNGCAGRIVASGGGGYLHHEPAVPAEPERDSDAARPLPTTTPTAPRSPRQKFAGVGWESIERQSLTPKTAPQTWTAQHDLAVDVAAAVPSLPFAQARELVSAAASGLPVVITWRTRRGEGAEVKRTAAVVTALQLGEWETSRWARVKTWGFSYTLPLADVLAVDVPETEWLTKAEAGLDADGERLEQGGVTCPECHAAIAWEGERPSDCLRCGALLSSSADAGSGSGS